ncbi:hypothetical protein [Pyruvatibacter sp.]|uniref:hypothetical protein n=1 Tax=Pyruvatibacter sp. TaxID=1981328 RepID=UPI003265FD43
MYDQLTIVAAVANDISASAAKLTALDEWNTVARDALPTHVRIWLGMMFLNNLAALAFVWRRVAARWVFGGFLVSHVLVIGGYWGSGTPILAGQVSLFHIIFWTPGIVALVVKRSEMRPWSAYSVWATLVFVFYAGSMSIDIRDAAVFLTHILSS